MDWIAATNRDCNSQSTVTLAEKQDLKQPKLLFCFSYIGWRLGDWCLLRTSVSEIRCMISIHVTLIEPLLTTTILQRKNMWQLFSAVKDDALYIPVMNTFRAWLTDPKNWNVAVKILATTNRLVMESHHPSIGSQYCYNMNALVTMSQFEDQSSLVAKECVFWFRTYSCYLSERNSRLTLFNWKSHLSQRRPCQS